MRSSDAQVKKLMKEMNTHGKLGQAALNADMSRETARKYVRSGKLPSELVAPRTWRTRINPFEKVWTWIETQLQQAPNLQSTTLWTLLQQQYPNQFQPGQLRTLQRLLRQWRARNGPDREVFFQQEHTPGEAAQTDFTHALELNITINGQLFDHLLCVFVLPFSNWMWVTVCLSESLPALRRGVQSALFRLGSVPQWHQTDNSTAATHELGKHTTSSQPRGFNAEYLALMNHFGMTPRTIEIGKSHQNGDVEAGNGTLKPFLRQMLMVRQSCDFSSRENYEQWMQSQVEQRNLRKAKALAIEQQVMKPLPLKRLPEHIERSVTVSKWSTIFFSHATYSVPSRLIREKVIIHMFDDRLEIFHGNVLQFTVERLRGKNQVKINYRHVIGSLLKKPGAFAHYKYRDELFPSLTFRRAYDCLVQSTPGNKADLAYLRILHVAATEQESQVEQALIALLEDKQLPSLETVRCALAIPTSSPVPAMSEPKVDLHTYDRLLREQYV